MKKAINSENDELNIKNVYQKIAKENDKEKIAEILDKYFYEAKYLENYGVSQLGDICYDEMKHYRPYALGLARTLNQKGLLNKETVSEFYNCLWEKIRNDDILSTEEAKIFSLWSIANEKIFPFYKFDITPMSVDEEKFKSLIKENINIIDKIRYIQNLSFSQRTQEISLILNEILKLDEFEDKVIVLLVAIQELAKKEFVLRMQGINKDDVTFD